MSTVQKLTERRLVQPPKWLPNSVQYETIMGSVAYGVSNDTSDMDIYGFCMPEKDMVFPHLRGDIPGFGRQVQRFGAVAGASRPGQRCPRRAGPDV